jgi:hypothetical protein
MAYHPFQCSSRNVSSILISGVLLGQNSANTQKRRSYDPSNQEVNILGQEKVTNMFIPALAELTPDGAAYLNEADFRQPDFQQVFYGANYEKLLAIKRKYDPNDMFYGLTAVGSEAWRIEYDGRLCKTV